MSLPPGDADLVFSSGLIEHFEAAVRDRAILVHRRAARCGGCFMISFPAATIPYRMARSIPERSGCWQFYDAPLAPLRSG